MNNFSLSNSTCSSNLSNTTWNCTALNTSMFASNATTSAHASYVVRHVVQALLGVMMVVANGVVIVSVCKMGKQRRPLHLWIANLAVADAVTGVTLIIKLIMAFAFPGNKVLCRVLFIIVTASIGCSGSSALAMSALSFYNIKQATTMTLGKKTSPGVTMAMITGIWAFFLISYSLEFTYLDSTKDHVKKECILTGDVISKQFILYIFILMNIITTGIVFIQVSIYVIVKRHFRNMVSLGVILKMKTKDNLRNKETVETVSAKIDTDSKHITCTTCEIVLANDADSKLGDLERTGSFRQSIGEIKCEQKGNVSEEIVPKASLYDTSPAGSLLAVKLHSENGVISKGKYEILISLILQWQDNPRQTMRYQLS